MDRQSHTIHASVSLENVSRFLDYFGVALGKFKFQGSEGSYLSDGGFQETYRCLLPISAEIETLATWRIILYADGTLAPLEVTVEEGAVEGWKQVAEDVVRGTLVDLINGAKSKFFQRHFFAYIGRPLDGEYYIGSFRIAPSLPANTFPFGLGEEVVILDMDAEGIDSTHAAPLGWVQGRRIASLLSVFLNIGLYTIPSTESRWFYDDDEGSKCAQLGYKSSLPKPKVIPPKGVECKPGNAYEVDRSKMEDIHKAGDLLRCPRDIRVLFRTLFSLPANEQTAFLGAASLSQIALVTGRYYPTVLMAYCIAAVDSLTQEHTMKAFVKLVCEFCPELPMSDTQLLYEKYRSAHFHSGALPGGELEAFDLTRLITSKRERLSKMHLPAFTREAMRTVLLRWLLRRSSEI